MQQDRVFSPTSAGQFRIVNRQKEADILVTACQVWLYQMGRTFGNWNPPCLPPKSCKILFQKDYLLVLCENCPKQSRISIENSFLFWIKTFQISNHTYCDSVLFVGKQFWTAASAWDMILLAKGLILVELYMIIYFLLERSSWAFNLLSKW